MLRSRALAAAAAAFALVLLPSPARLQSLDGCPSAAILQRFEEFQRAGKMPPDLGRWLSEPTAQYIEPYKAFDNVYYVGVCWASAWLIKTRDGAILIDTLHDPFADLLIDNIRKTGVDPTDIKYVLITHGHFDHAGGAYKLKPLTRAQFLMTQKGWNEAIESAKASLGTPRPWTMIPQDRVVNDGDVIRLGEQDVRVLETPGHTWGTASYLFQVTDGDKS